MRILEIFGLKHKVRDAVANGYPATIGTRVVMQWRNRTTQSTNVRVWVTTIDSRDGTSRTQSAIGPVSSANTDFSGETTQQSVQGLFSNHEIITNVQVTAANITNPVQLWVGLFLSDQSATATTFLSEGYVHSNNVVGWANGVPVGIQSSATADGGTQGALFTFQGTVVNGAGGAGDQSMTVAAATGSRLEIRFLRVLNGDTANRSMTGQILDGVGGNILSDPWIAANVNAGVAVNFPTQSPAASTGMLASGFGPGGVCELAGGNVAVFTLAAVAASENSAWSFQARLWGAAPTITLAGASTPTLTTNTSRFETG